MSIKQVLGFAKNEFIYGGHLLSLGSVSIVFVSSILLNIKITWDFLVISYLVTYIAYSYNRLMELKSDSLTNPLRTLHIKKYMKWLPLIIFFCFFIVAILLLRFGNANSAIFAIFMVAGSLLYTVHFKNYTKKIIGFKSVYVSLFWASLVLLLALYYRTSINLAVISISLFVFLRLLVNTIFFDIKDIASDKLYSLKTLPVYLGRRKVLSLIHILNLVSFLLLVVCVYKGVLPPGALSLLVFFIYTCFYLGLAKKEGTDMQKLSYFMVDGEYILWPFVIFIFKNLVSL
jgi:4-hydroxybenzoate polyprenyltransferase